MQTADMIKEDPASEIKITAVLKLAGQEPAAMLAWKWGYRSSARYVKLLFATMPH